MQSPFTSFVLVLSSAALCACQTADDQRSGAGPHGPVLTLSPSSPRGAAGANSTFASTPGETTTVPASTPTLRDAEVETDAPALNEDGDDRWRFVVAPYGWLLGVDGNVTIQGNEVRVDQGFGDLVDDISVVAEGRFEVWEGDWGAVADVTYARLESDTGAGSMQVDSTADIYLLVAGGMHRLVDQDVDENGVGGIKVDGFLGIGYTALHADLDGAIDVSRKKGWFDPLLGLRTRYNFSENWVGSFELNIGGFELFDGSDLFSMYTVLIGRNFGEKKNKTIYVGYREAYIDYDDGHGTDKFEFDVNIYGPIVGLEWRF